MITFEFSAQVKKPPYLQGLIDLDGADTALAHFIGGVDLSDLEKVKDKVRIGMRVEAKWREERGQTSTISNTLSLSKHQFGFPLRILDQSK